MSMIGEYARLSPVEMDRAVRDPQWAYDHVQDLLEVEIPPGDVGHCTDVDKAWDGIGYLLRHRGDARVDVIGGGTLLDADDWGYGPPRYLTVDQVGHASAHLLATPFADLAPHYDAARMRDEKIYPHAIWDDDASTLDYLRDNYEALTEFFETAASSGEAVILWLD